MHNIVIATADENLGARLLGRLASRGYAAEFCATWADTLVRSTRKTTRLLLVDSDLPGASGPLLREMGEVLPSAPIIRTIRGALPHLEQLETTEELLALASAATPPILDEYEQRLLEHAGLGPEPMATLHAAARNPMPVLFEGERGTGKEWVAGIVHRLSEARGPFISHNPVDDITVHGATPGTLYLANVDMVSAGRIDEMAAFAQATGWKLLTGSRRPPETRLASWTHLRLRPLRERPKDIRSLARLYLETWSDRLGLPRRRVHHTLWKLMERHAWPGNQRELETFVVQAVTSAQGVMISRGSLPHAVLSRLDPAAREARETRAFEEMVEERLRPLVARYEPDPGGHTLYMMVINATEQALLRLALQRTGGNQKAAAILLGIARNTLRSRLDRLERWEDEA
ncbi:MAG: sigma 54-interacting transcriptional regulator [Deltaproteobacteria bacterium]|nr:sigma 54-interacting transcriptional regulator [Deltaproteobacteria bacterium]MBW2256463.1 sigma 54-interacting transcriptional regulator [Deltaproteobacteria bacterium]